MILLDFERKTTGQVICKPWQLTGRFSNGGWQAAAWQEALELKKKRLRKPKVIWKSMRRLLARIKQKR